MMSTLTVPPLGTASPFVVETISTDAGMASLAGDWRRLAGDVPFRSYEWLSTWWRHYRASTDELQLMVVRDQAGAILGIAPWYLQRSVWWGRTLRFLGDGEVCSDYLSLLAEPSCETAVTMAIADYLTHVRSVEWDLLDLSGVRCDDTAMTSFVLQMANAGCAMRRRDDLSCWRVELCDDWDQFLKSLSKSRRERTRSMIRRVVESGRGKLHTIADENELMSAFDVLVELHQKRRQSLGEPGCFASPRFKEFHREVVETMWRVGRLKLQWLSIDGRAAAVEYSLLGGDTVYYYQGGFEPELADERPGWLSFAIALRDSISAGYKHYDFLRGDESYKASWRAEPLPICSWRIANGRGASRWKLAAWSAIRTARSRLTSHRAASAGDNAAQHSSSELAAAK